MALTCDDPVTIVKFDSCRTYIQTIPVTEDAGVSIAKINSNFTNLDAAVTNLQLSATNYWNPLYATLNSLSAAWNSVYATLNSLSSCWNSTYTSVTQLSASWLQPISVIYPLPLPRPFNVQAVVAWAQANFPITVATSSTNCNTINFAEGQKLWIFTAQHIPALQQVYATCNTNCTLANVTVAYSIAVIHGSISGAVTLVPGGSSGGFYIAAYQSGTSTCEARGTYTDTYVDRIVGIELCVVAGAWRYIGLLPGYSAA